MPDVIVADPDYMRNRFRLVDRWKRTLQSEGQVTGMDRKRAILKRAGVGLGVALGTEPRQIRRRHCCIIGVTVCRYSGGLGTHETGKSCFGCPSLPAARNRLRKARRLASCRR